MYQDQQGWSLIAGIVFWVMGLTDLFDGILARSLKQVTVWGKFLDPIADKLLISSVLIMLVYLGRVEAWAAIVIIGREISVTGLRAVAESQGFSLPSDQWGKAKAAIQIVAVWMVIFYWPQGPQWMLSWGYWIMCIAVAITAYSGLMYFVEFNRLLKASEEQANRGIRA